MTEERELINVHTISNKILKFIKTRGREWFLWLIDDMDGRSRFHNAHASKYPTDEAKMQYLTENLPLIVRSIIRKCPELKERSLEDEESLEEALLEAINVWIETVEFPISITSERSKEKIQEDRPSHLQIQAPSASRYTPQSQFGCPPQNYHRVDQQSPPKSQHTAVNAQYIPVCNQHSHPNPQNNYQSTLKFNHPSPSRNFLAPKAIPVYEPDVREETKKKIFTKLLECYDQPEKRNRKFVDIWDEFKKL